MIIVDWIWNPSHYRPYPIHEEFSWVATPVVWTFGPFNPDIVHYQIQKPLMEVHDTHVNILSIRDRPQACSGETEGHGP